ncbi:MAG TPA: FAD-binding oxidoreductase [Nocardioides sp.]|nr:FAD-binding oxidoreductase [Nocardioides sp.]
MTPAKPSAEMHPTRWGDPSRARALPDAARGLVELVFPVSDRSIDESVAPAVPPSALPAEAVDALAAVVGADHVLTDDETRRLRTRGKSTPDLLRARAGDLSDTPDAVVRPADGDEVQRLLEVASAYRLAVVPFGGGTSVVGGLVARREGFVGVVSLDLVRMKRLLDLDPVSMTATLEPGLRGPEAEGLLAEHGMTLGHFPQSFEFATIGGYAATRSSGQSSAGYGRFDALVVGLAVATPAGPVVLGHAPASAAGPDLRQLFLGSEGALGVITSVTVRVRTRPEVKVYEGWRWASFDDGARAMRTLAQVQMLPTVLRLSDENETALNLADPDSIGGSSEGGCLMIVGHEGTPAVVEARRAAVTALLTDLGGSPAGEEPGRTWAAGRFDSPYLRDSMLDLGVLVETLETATHWSRLREVYDAVSAALTGALGDPALVLCHVSHVYETGASLYFTVAAPEGDDPLARWSSAKAAALDAIVAGDATITHHHAVGTDHRPWLEAEIGPLGVSVLRAVKAVVDPDGILNPGVLVPGAVEGV